jgi:hypothetical protein
LMFGLFGVAMHLFNLDRLRDQDDDEPW